MCQVTWNALPTSSFSKRQVDDIFGVLEMWPFHLSTLATALKNQEHGIHQQETTCEVAMKKGDDSIAGIIDKKTTNVVTSHKIWSWTSIPNCSFVRKHLKTYSSVSQQKVGWLPLTPRQSCFCFYKWSGPPVDKHVFSKTLLNTMR